MSDDHQPESRLEPKPVRPPRTWKRLLIVATPLVCLLIGVWWVMWGAAADLPDQAVTVKRGPNGEFRQVAENSAGLKGHLSSLKSNTSISTVSSTSTTNGTVLRAHSALVSVEGQDLLAQRVADELFQKLQSSRYFQTLHYLPPGERWPAKKRLPDIFITVGLNSLEESGVIPFRSLDAEVSVHMSDRYRRSNHSYTHTFTPPDLKFRWNSVVDYSASEIGIETASARYAAIGADIAGQISEKIIDDLGEWVKKHGLAGETPPEYLPEYVPAPKFPFLEELNAERILSGPTFMKQNVTVWKIPAASVPANIVDRIANGLREAGWKVPKQGEASERHYLKAGDEDSVVFIAFPEGSGFSIGPDDSQPQNWYCVYEQRMTAKEGTAALRAILKRGVPESVLVQFSRWWYLEPELVEAYFRRHPPTLTPSLRYLAQERIDQGQLAEARQILLRASALQRIRTTQLGPSAEMKKLAKKAGLKAFPELPDLSALQEGDLVDLRDGKPERLRLKMGETLIALLTADDQEQRYYCLTPFRAGDGGIRLRRQPVTLGKGHNSWGNQTQSLFLGKTIDFPLTAVGKDLSYTLSVTLLPDGKSVEIIMEPANEAPPETDLI